MRALPPKTNRNYKAKTYCCTRENIWEYSAKKGYFIEQKKTTCPGCRQESIDLRALSRYRKVKDSPSINLVSYAKLGKIITMFLYFVLATVFAYWIGTILLYSSAHFRSNEHAIIILRLLVGYFILYILSACIYLWCCLT